MGSIPGWGNSACQGQQTNKKECFLLHGCCCQGVRSFQRLISLSHWSPGSRVGDKGRECLRSLLPSPSSWGERGLGLAAEVTSVTVWSLALAPLPTWASCWKPLAAQSRGLILKIFAKLFHWLTGFIELIVRRAHCPGCLGLQAVDRSFRCFFSNWGTGYQPTHNWDGVWQPPHHLLLRTVEHFLLAPALALFSFSENILPSLNPRTHVARFLSGCLNAQLPGCVLVTCKLRGLWTALVPLKIRDKPLNWEGTTSGYPADPEVILVQEFVYKPFINTVSCYQQIRNIFYSIEINICILAYEIVTTSLKLTVLSLVSCLSTLLFCSILYSK